jgi:hypothetical protein
MPGVSEVVALLIVFLHAKQGGTERIELSVRFALEDAGMCVLR